MANVVVPGAVNISACDQQYNLMIHNKMLLQEHGQTLMLHYQQLVKISCWSFAPNFHI